MIPLNNYYTADAIAANANKMVIASGYCTKYSNLRLGKRSLYNPNVQGCDATGDPMKYFSPAQKKFPQQI